MNKYFSDSFAAQLDKFVLRAKYIVEGFMIGLHKSPYHGFSAEFSDHRQYNPGDNLKNIDWKVFGKTDRYYVKQYEEETNLKSYILLDHSSSMKYASGNVSKLEYGKAIASAMGYLLLKQNDAVGLATFTEKITNIIPPKAMQNHLNRIQKILFELESSDQTNTVSVLHQLAGQLKKRGLIILITDLLDDAEEIIQGLRHFRHQKHEVIVFHLQDQHELNFDFRDETEFIDSETGEKVVVTPHKIRKDYLDALEKHQNFLKKKLWESSIDYFPISTKTPFEEVLIKFLSKRNKLF